MAATARAGTHQLDHISYSATRTPNRHCRRNGAEATPVDAERHRAVRRAFTGIRAERPVS